MPLAGDDAVRRAGWPAPLVPDAAPRRDRRLLLAVAVALATAAYSAAYGWANPQFTSDFDQVWAAARALVARENPYEVIGIARPFYWWWPFYYPLPAAVLALPLGALPVIAARAAFSGLSAGLLAWGLTRDGWFRLPALISIPFVVSVELGQWAPLMTAALLLPWLSWVGVAKPNWGIAIVAHASSGTVWRPLLVGTGVLLLASFALQPGWVADWLGHVNAASHFEAPLWQPGGFLMLAALLRWRRPEARLLVAMCLLPQTPGFYDALMLFVIPRTFREALALAVLGFVVFFAMAFRQPWPTAAAWMADISRFTLWFEYLPCVAMVLARPNEGTLPLPGRRRAPAAA